jgi:hypothetical protein
MGRLHIHSFVTSLLDGVDLSASFSVSFTPGGRSTECLISRKGKSDYHRASGYCGESGMSCPPEKGSQAIASLCYSKSQKEKQEEKKIKEKKKRSRMVLAMKVCEVK